MKFKSLFLLNYRKYKKATFIFRDGITAIIGNNGVGKTTIFEAILFSLFGTIAIRGDKSKIRNRLSIKDNTEVVFEFEIFEDKYRITRVIKGNNDTISSLLYKNNIEIAKTTTAVNNEIKKIFNLDYKSFEISTFAKQGEISTLSNMDTSERRGIIPKLIRIDDIDKAVKNIKDDKKELSIKLEALKRSAEDPKELNNTIVEKQKSIVDLEKTIKENTDILIKNNSLIKQLKKTLEEDQNKYIKFQSLNNELKSMYKIFTDKKEELSNMKLKIDEVKDLKKKLSSFDKATIMETITRHTEELAKLNREKESMSNIKFYDSRVKNIEATFIQIIKREEELKKISDLNIAPLEKIDVNLEKIAEAKSKLEKILAISNNRIITLQKNIEALKTNTKCPTCETELSNHADLLKKFNDELLLHIQKINKVQSKLHDLEQKKSILKSKLSQSKEIHDRKREWEIEIKQHKELCNKIFEIKKEMLDIYDNISSSTIDIGSEKGQDVGSVIRYCQEITVSSNHLLQIINKNTMSISNKLKGLENSLNEIKVLEKTIDNLNYTVSSANKLKNDLIKLKEDINTKKSEVVSLGEIKDTSGDKEKLTILEEENNKNKDSLDQVKVKIGIYKGEIKNLKERLKNTDKQVKERKQNEEEIITLTKLIEKMNLFKTNLLSRIRPQLSKIGSELIEQTTNGKYQKMELDENYDIYIHSFGAKENMDFYSGGEVHLANLCMRIAISKLIAQNFKCLVLDEIFGFQDNDRKPEIISAFKNLIGSSFDQILVITHDPFIKEKSDNLIQIKETSDGFNEVICF